MPRPYETVLILDSSLDDAQVEERIDRFKSILGGGEADSVSVTHWGLRKLAYPINKKEQGFYAVFRYETEPSALTEFERVSKLDELVLRQLTVVNPVGEVTEPRVPGEEEAAASEKEQE